MLAFAWMLLLAASTRVNLVDENYKIEADKWNWVALEVRQKPVLVEARYEVTSGQSDVRLALMRRASLGRLLENLPQDVIDVTALGKSGRLDYLLRRPDEYAIVIDNRSDRAASVHLAVTLDFAPERAGPERTQISPERQMVVILVSFAVFFGVVSWSARRLLKSMRR